MVRPLVVGVGGDGRADDVDAALLKTSQRHQLSVGVLRFGGFDLLQPDQSKYWGLLSMVQWSCTRMVWNGKGTEQYRTEMNRTVKKQNGSSQKWAGRVQNEW